MLFYPITKPNISIENTFQTLYLSRIEFGKKNVVIHLKKNSQNTQRFNWEWSIFCLREKKTREDEDTIHKLMNWPKVYGLV